MSRCSFCYNAGEPALWILFHMLFETVWIYHDSARTTGQSSQNNLHITGCSDIHKGTQKMFTINANKFILLGNVCAVDCNNCVKGAATAPNCIFFMLPWSQAVQEKMMYLGLELFPPTLWAEHGSERSEMSWLETLCCQEPESCENLEFFSETDPVSASTFNRKTLGNQKQHISHHHHRSENQLGLERLALTSLFC